MTSLVGQTINNRYRLDALLGDGGMGTVYRAYDLNLERQVAIKLMHSHYARQAEFRARLGQEAQTTGQLDHPSIVRIYDFGGDSNLGLFIAMEYVSGGSLRDLLRRLQSQQKYLPLAQSLQIGIQIAEALDYAHHQGVIHRDVKPGNIILKRLNRPDEPGQQPFRALLTDFGLVKLLGGQGMTESGATLGTPAYMSPEQCEGKVLDGRTDLYSLGIVLYELITNKLPFGFKSLSEAIAAHIRGAMPPFVSEARADVPMLIDGLLVKALAKEPRERYASGAEMAAALRSALKSLESDHTRHEVREEVSMLARVPEPPPGYELRISTPGHDPDVIPLTRSVISLGRRADNHIVLPAEGVSRNHAELRATSLGWELEDLDTINGTFLNGTRLRAKEPTPFVPGSMVTIGPYELTLLAPDAPVQEASAMGPTVLRQNITPGLQRLEPAPALLAAEPEQPLAMFLARDSVTVDPGQRVDMTIEVVNRTAVADRVSVRVQGLPPSWVLTPDQFVNVSPGGTTPMTVSFRPPRHRATPSGRQRFRIELVSQQHPDLKLGQSASLVLGSFVAFEASLDVEQVRLPGVVVVSVQNTGNAPASFSVVARDREGLLRFRGETGRIQIEPGQLARIELAVESRSPSVFGGGQLYPLEVEVVSRTGGRQVLSAEARSGSIMPTWAIYGLVFLVTFACALSAIAAIANWDRWFGQPPTPIAIGIAGPQATETAVALIAVQQTATRIAEEAAQIGDEDSDGLTNTQETEIGTDPRKADTDGDGVSDGNELLIYASDPLKRDSDGDILSDGDEVNLYKTNPAKADTDGDGIADGVELTRGSDPLVPQATPTPTATTTATPNSTPSVTATATATLQPSVTPTITQTPTATPTPTNTTTPLPTFTPTATGTATFTATPAPPTPTPTPAPPTPTPTATAVAVDTSICIPTGQTPPVIDGNFVITDWPNQPIIQFQAPDNSSRLVQVYLRGDASKLYWAFLINDDSTDTEDSLRIYFDATNNGGDPDSADRFFQIVRDGTIQAWAGISSNTDGQTWTPIPVSPNWTAVIGTSSSQWIVEMSLDPAAEMGGLANPYALMLQVLYAAGGSGNASLVTWPLDANSGNPNSWQDVVNVSCP